jgi:hypothetical protein
MAEGLRSLVWARSAPLHKNAGNASERGQTIEIVKKNALLEVGYRSRISPIHWGWHEDDGGQPWSLIPER